MKLIFAIATVLVLALTAAAQSDCELIKEDFGGFSLCAPAGWTIAGPPGEIYHVAYGAAEDGFTPNINFKSHGNDLSLAEFTNSGIEILLASAETFGFSNVRLKSRSRFVTNARSVGVKVVFLSEVQGLKLRTVQYYFARKDGDKLVITGTTLENRGAALELVFDRAVRSLKLFDIIITPHS